jgi:hypothetical protein
MLSPLSVAVPDDITPASTFVSTTSDRWLSIKHAALYSDDCERTIRRAISGGRLKAVRCGRVWRTKVSWIDAWKTGDGRD